MDYKQYLSALFYLTESLKYLSEPHKSAVYGQVVRLCRAGFEDTGVIGFKVYEMLYTNFPEHVSFNKSNLQKTGFTIYLGDRDLTGPEQRPAFYQHLAIGKEDEEVAESDIDLDLFGGHINLNSSCNDWIDDEQQYQGYWYMHITARKMKDYSDQELNELMNRLTDFIPRTNLRIVA